MNTARRELWLLAAGVTAPLWAPVLLLALVWVAWETGRLPEDLR